MRSGKRLLICTAVLLVASHSRAQEHPVQPQNWENGFRLAMPGYSFAFPRDHAAHPEFRTEWWYFTGHLAEGDRRSTIDARRDHENGEVSFGYELTFFRNAIQPAAKTHLSAWSLRDVYFAHFAISDLRAKKFWFSEQISRGALGLAGAETNSLHVWNQDWSLGTEKDGSWKLQASRDGYAIELDLKSEKPEVIHGERGVSQKAAAPGRSTHYVSFTQMKTTGRLSTPGRTATVAGESWFDHEFGSNLLAENQVGWDWFSLQLASGEELMIYLLRKTNGCYEMESSGTWVDAQGKSTHLPLDTISVLSTASWKSPKTGATYPARWEIRVPSRKVNVVVEPLLADQELVVAETASMAYWEGACRVSGTHSGRAYVELTGYDRPVKK